MKTSELLAIIVLTIAAFSPAPDEAVAPAKAEAVTQAADALLAGQVMAGAYSGFREGQHPEKAQM